MRIKHLLSSFQLPKLILSMNNVQLLFLSGQDIKKRTAFGVMVLNIFNAALVLTFSLIVSTFDSGNFRQKENFVKCNWPRKQILKLKIFYF